jgi:putative ABC transport system permease protein
MAIRTSLGATRRRIVGQLLIESLFLASLGGIVGFALSIGGVHVLQTLLDSLGAPPYWIRFTIDANAVAFVTLACLGTTLVFGLVPALHASKTDVHTTLKEAARSASATRHSQRWVGALVVGQFSLTLILLAGAGAFGRAFADQYQQDPGYDTHGVTRAVLDLPSRTYPTPDTRLSFYRRLDARLATLPYGAAVTAAMPNWRDDTQLLTVDDMGQPHKSALRVYVKAVGPRYFQTLGIQILRGRAFTERDGSAGNDVAIVDDRFAATHLSGADPLGARIRVARPNDKTSGTNSLIVIGVVRSLPVQATAFTSAPLPLVYLPYGAPPTSYSNYSNSTSSSEPDLLSMRRSRAFAKKSERWTLIFPSMTSSHSRILRR